MLSCVRVWNEWIWRKEGEPPIVILYSATTPLKVLANV